MLDLLYSLLRWIRPFFAGLDFPRLRLLDLTVPCRAGVRLPLLCWISSALGRSGLLSLSAGVAVGRAELSIVQQDWELDASTPSLLVSDVLLNYMHCLVRN